MQRIATLIHAADECNVTNANLVSFLRIGHAASQNIKNMQQLTTENDQYIWIERVFELFRSPLFTVFTLERVEAPAQVAKKSAIDPITFFRLLTVLAERGVLSKIQKWKELPEGTSPSISLTQAK